MSSDQQNSSIPVSVPSVQFLAYLRHIANREALDSRTRPPMALALDDAADADRGFAALGETEPAAHRLLVHDLRELGRSGLHMRVKNGRWGVIGLGSAALFDRDAAPALTVGGGTEVSELVTPIALEHAQRVWIYAQLSDRTQPPALINLPVVSQAGNVLLQMGLAADALEARDRISAAGGQEQGERRDAYLETAARHLSQAAGIIDNHPQLVVSELTAIVGAHRELALRDSDGVGDRLSRVVDPRRSLELSNAIVEYERASGIPEGWTTTSLSMASLAFGRGRAATGATLERSVPSADA
jgi:hypothetical protein